MRTAIALFVSYAHADQRPADTLMQRLTEQLAPSKRYAYTFWRDTGLLVGDARSFADCTSDRLRRRFVEQLLVQIERRLDRLYAQR